VLTVVGQQDEVGDAAGQGQVAARLQTSPRGRLAITALAHFLHPADSATLLTCTARANNDCIISELFALASLFVPVS
jgi:hypothetical protein